MSAVKFSQWFTLVSFVVSSQLLSLHPFSVVPAQLFYLIFSEVFTKSSFFVNSEKVRRTQKRIVLELFWKSCWLTASKFAEVEPQDKSLPWSHWYHILRYFLK